MDPFHIFYLSNGLPALCGTTGWLGASGIAGALFAAAVVGGFAHCAPMCGPFVLMQVAAVDGGGFAIGRSSGALPGYQLGRMTTYVALGSGMGAIGQSIEALSPFRGLAALLLGLAAVSFLLQALKPLFPHVAARTGGWGAWLASPLALLLRPGGIALQGYPLGIVLGLLPCGFLYAALFAAAASGSALAGALAMAGFALGTMPALMTVGVLGRGAAQRWRQYAAPMVTPVLLFNALLLAGLAARTLT